VNGKLLAQLGVLFQRESDAIRRDYAWPPHVMTTEEREESERLRITASRFFYGASRLGWGTAGYSEIFAPDEEQPPDTIRTGT
jgi:hypothetical protein